MNDSAMSGCNQWIQGLLRITIVVGIELLWVNLAKIPTVTIPQSTMEAQ